MSGPSPHFGRTFESTFSPLSFVKSFMKIHSAVPENGCLVFCDGRKKTEKKTSVKHIRIRLIGGCVNKGSSELYCVFTTAVLFCDPKTSSPDLSS